MRFPIPILATLSLSIALSSSYLAAAEPNTDKDEAPLVKEATRLFADGKYDQAFEKLQEACKTDPSLPPARLMMARMLLQSGIERQQLGRDFLERAGSENPNHPEVYLTNARIALAEGRITDTILNCGVALQITDAPTWTKAQRLTFKREANAGLSTCYEQRQDWGKALIHLVAWSDLEPDNAQVRQRLARALFLTGREAEAFDELKAAEKLDKKADDAAITMAQFYAGVSTGMKPAEAAAAKRSAEFWLRLAISERPFNTRAYQAYASWLIDEARNADAGNIIKKSKEIDPDSTHTLLLEGMLAYHQKDYVKAEKIFQEVVVREPNNFFASHMLRETWRALGKIIDLEWPYPVLGIRENAAEPSPPVREKPPLWRNSEMNFDHRYWLPPNIMPR